MFHPQKCGDTLKSAATPSKVLSHPDKFCHTLKSAVTHSKVQSHPQKYCHTPKSTVTPSKALSYPQKPCTPLKVLPHPQKPCHTLKPSPGALPGITIESTTVVWLIKVSNTVWRGTSRIVVIDAICNLALTPQPCIDSPTFH